MLKQVAAMDKILIRIRTGRLQCSSQILLLYESKAEWSKLVSIPMVELVLELDPVQP